MFEERQKEVSEPAEGDIVKILDFITVFDKRPTEASEPEESNIDQILEFLAVLEARPKEVSELAEGNIDMILEFLAVFDGRPKTLEPANPKVKNRKKQSLIPSWPKTFEGEIYSLQAAHKQEADLIKAQKKKLGQHRIDTVLHVNETAHRERIKSVTKENKHSQATTATATTTAAATAPSYRTRTGKVENLLR